MALKIIYPESFKKLDDFQEPGLRDYLKAFLEEDHQVSAIFKDFILNNK
ncbi:MAG: hypothetical protein JWQ25_2876, partial [Daejeonella sp.]|nr:hypothetical protein [Daejeonella sp.]